MLHIHSGVARPGEVRGTKIQNDDVIVQTSLQLSKMAWKPGSIASSRSAST